MIRINYLWQLFPLKLLGCGLHITTRLLFCSRIFGAVRIFSVWGFTLYEMGGKLLIYGSGGENIYTSGRVLHEDFVLNRLPWNRRKITNSANKFLIDCIDGEHDGGDKIRGRNRGDLVWQLLTWRHTSMPTTALWRWPNRRGYIGSLTSSPTSMTASACGQTQEIK